MARDFSSGNYLAMAGPDTLIAVSTPFSLSARINPDGFAADATVLSKYNGTAGPIIRIAGAGNSKVGLFCLDNASSGQEAVGATSLTAGVWQQVGGAWDGSSVLRCVLNGVQDGTDTMGQIASSQATDWNIGRRPSGTNPFDGKIAEVAMWSAYLSDDEWLALGKGFSPLLVRPQSLAGYWPLLAIANPEPDLKGLNSATIGGTPAKVNDHPRVYVPRPAIYLP